MLKNAIEACSGVENPRIVIKTGTLDDNNVFLDITNNGPAISAEETESIFTPFFSTKSSGQGIGLSLARRIMNCQGGSLHLLRYPSLTSPTTFRFTFKRL